MSNRKDRRRKAAKQRRENKRAGVFKVPHKALQAWAEKTSQTHEFDPTDRSQRVSPHASVMVADNPDWTPFENMGPSRDGSTIWRNSRYQVAVYPPRPAFVEGWPPIIHLSFKRVDNIAITDFRDFQRIKNELVSPEAEALQIFPPERHLTDTSNQYHLWIMAPMPDDSDNEYPHLPFGFRDGRYISDEISEMGHGRQRSFEEGERPDDCLTERDMYRRFWEVDSPEAFQRMIDTCREGNADGMAGRIEQWRDEFEAEAKYRIYFDDVDANNDGHGWNVVDADEQGDLAGRFKTYPEALEWVYTQEGVSLEGA